MDLEHEERLIAEVGRLAKRKKGFVRIIVEWEIK